MIQVFGNSQAQAKSKQALEYQTRSLCLVGQSHIGKSSYVKAVLADTVPESDLFVADKSIESSREAVEFSKTQPLGGSNRYVIVDEAQLLSEAAQDAYLKLLEEPGNHACIIFVVSDDGLLQQAIRSRFRSTIRWKPLSLVDMRQFAESFGSGEDSRALMLCGGRPGLFHSMFEDEGGTKHAELYDVILQAFDHKTNLLLDKTPDVVKEAKELIQKECVAQVCQEAATTLLRFKKAPIDQIAHLLRYSAILTSLPSASSEIYWLRMAAHVFLLM